MDIPRFCIGPMSVQIVDSIIEFSLQNNKPIWLIPSRRQIECDGGYVNNWNTKDFSRYINNRCVIMRDHAGPDQGNNSDYGYVSLGADAKYFNGIHIDPWKRYNDIEDAARSTAHLIDFCYTINKNLFYEIGTEQAIRELSVDEMEKFILCVKQKLEPKIFDKIIYFVIQSGTALKENKNIGNFNKQKLLDMISLCKRFGFKSKEHNGDYLSKKEIKERFDNGLDTLNIAPEFGVLQSRFLLEQVKDNKRNYDLLFKICLESMKWCKWVGKDFNPNKQKDELILISGHYVLSNPNIKLIIKSIEDFDIRVKEIIKNKLSDLYVNINCTQGKF